MHKIGTAYSEVTQKKFHGQQLRPHPSNAAPSSTLCLEAPNPNHLLLAKATLQSSEQKGHIQGYARGVNMTSKGLIQQTSCHGFSRTVLQGQPVVIITFLCKEA
jgi:hypothetical protein